MMFGVIASNGDVMSAFIFPDGMRLNTKAYIKFLEEVALLWDEREALWKALCLTIEFPRCHVVEQNTKTCEWERWCGLANI